MANYPHFALPFRYEKGTAVVNEQDTDADVAACVQAVALTRQGELPDLPSFGTEDPTFEQEPLNIERVLTEIMFWEPRALLLAETAPNALEAAIVNANIFVTTLGK